MERQDFLDQAKKIAEISDKIRDGWALKNAGEGRWYLEKRQLLLIEGEPINWLYNVLFSPSFSSPVIYFNANDAQGGYLGYERILASLEHAADSLGENPLQVVSQKQHPFLSTPFYHFHPCRSDRLLGDEPAKNGLLRWLSAVAPLVKLKLSNEYAFPFL
ncbi:ubiquitin-like-conjugating enzyme ATG10 [Cimex lectularius]|uniref:Ubiquitin-like-conjugating enzyme ATG10 n=1 Tax=Cimex lectularius TaxID=79782 RepID=A0A8I6RKN6_CIMLE|nr:ubiquitin-like-conjugating enzyme ATG10 [Cimex lectularius]